MYFIVWGIYLAILADLIGSHGLPSENKAAIRGAAAATVTLERLGWFQRIIEPLGHMAIDEQLLAQQRHPIGQTGVPGAAQL